MSSEFKIMAGKVADIEDVRRNEKLLEDWIFVDIGFARKGKSCGVAIGSCNAKEITFGELVDMVKETVKEPGKPLNLLLESPLSMAFAKAGNPWPRNFEWSTRARGNDSPKWFKDLIDGTDRFWYSRAGASTKAGAERLIWKLHRCKRRREIRLFEGFAPLKNTKHKAVAEKLRAVVKGKIGCPIVSPNAITAGRKHTHLWPIPGIAGWDSDEPPEDCMIPPVVWVPPKCLGEDPEKHAGQCPCAIVRNQVP